MKTDPSNLDNELAQARALYETIKGDASMEVKCLDLISRLSHRRDQHEALSNYLHRGTVTRLGEALLEIISDEIRGLPNWEDVLGRICERIVPSIESASNTRPETRAITRREG